MKEVVMAPIVQPDLTSARFKANPYPFYARLRAEAPVYCARLAGKKTAWLVTGYDDVLAVLKDERLVKDPLNARVPGQSGKQPWVPGLLKPLARNMLDLDDPDHARLRALVHKAFTPRRVEQLRERIETLCDALLNAARSQTPVDLISRYALPVPLTVISELLGIPPHDRRHFHRWTSRFVAVSSGRDLLLALPSLWMFTRYLRRLIAQRRKSPGDDLITALLQAEEAGDLLSEDELLAMVTILIIAGHETTVNLIGNGTLALLQHPDQLALLRARPSLINSAVEELLRFTSPLQIATERYAREELTIAGTTIPRGALVLAVVGSANRDERQFPDPDKLDITREPNRHLAFGQGSHYCVGAPLARLEGQIAIETLLRHSQGLRLAVPPASLCWSRGLVLRGLERLPLVL
jgi:cytochrome P450